MQYNRQVGQLLSKFVLNSVQKILLDGISNIEMIQEVNSLKACHAASGFRHISRTYR